MKQYKLFSGDGCVTKEALQLYSREKLSENEKQQIEKHAATCEMCHDALLGADVLQSSLDRKTFNVKHRYYSAYRRKNESANQSAIVRLIGPLFLLTGLLVVLWFLNIHNGQLKLKRHYEEIVTDSVSIDTTMRE